MKLFVTGASGFLGGYVVDAARTRGHEVVRLVRRVETATTSDDHVRSVAGDIRNSGPWIDALRGVDAVVHLAAAKGGDFHTQFASTVIGTEVLLDAMQTVGVSRLVHVSTFSVYDYRALPTGAILDERAPIEAHPLDRDNYAQTKIVQEELVRAFAGRGGEVTIVRPGAVYGAGNLWDGGLAAVLPGGLGVAIAPSGELKLTYVENCAEAIVLAAERENAIGATLNIVDDERPTQRQFARALRRHGVHLPSSAPVPYRLARGFAAALDAINQRALGGRAKFPGIVVPAKLDAQFRPLHYTNAEAKRVLGWHPHFGLDDAIRRSIEGAP